jgi:hypothetical protein
MSLEHNKEVRADASQNIERMINKSRRSFARAGVVAPIIMTLASKSALGSTYQCTISGAQSGNTSSHPEASDLSECNIGGSPLEYLDGASITTSSTTGNVTQWCEAGINPFSIKTGRIPGSQGNNNPQIQILNPNGNGSFVWIHARNSNGKAWKDVYDLIHASFPSNPANATTFESIFPGSGISKSVWEVLHSNQSSLEAHAIADYINAKLCLNLSFYQEIYNNIHPLDIVNLYFLAKNPNSSFESYYSNRKIDGNFNGGDIQGYLAMIHG